MSTKAFRTIAFHALMWGSVILTSEVLSSAGGALLERWSSSIDMKRTSQIYEEQKRQIELLYQSDAHVVYDQDLGWTYRALYRGRQYSNNSIGARGTREFQRIPPPNVLRIAAFGDSFVYGNEVGDEDTWSYQLERFLPNVEVLNFGVGGYGTDQAYLRYKKVGRRYDPYVVLIGLVSVDIPRNVNVYRRFISTSELALFKPRFTLSSAGELTLIPMPVKSEQEIWRYYEQPQLIRDLGKIDYAYKPLVYDNPLYDYSPTLRLVSQALEQGSRKITPTKRLHNGKVLNSESEAFKITLAILMRFCNDVKADGRMPIVIVFPSYEATRQDGAERIKDYQPFLEALRSEQIEVVDLADAFETEPVTSEQNFTAMGHYTPHSHRLVAKFLRGYLEERNFLRHTKSNT